MRSAVRFPAHSQSVQPAMEAAPLVSVVTVGWNHSHLLKNCIGSLEAVTPLGWAERTELVVVNNGSVDDTAHFLEGAPEPAAAPTPDLPPGASGDWWSQIQADIRKSEYSATWQEKTLLPEGRPAYQAPNRARNLRTYFSGDGVRVVARTTDLPPWQGAAHAGSGAATGTGRRGPAACAPATSVAALTYAPTASSRGGRRPDDPRPGVQRRKS